ncbi:alpha/beta fold hydrolase [Aquabacter cavernae]|uniref:alpha/beta fold hydrolase n=1 Tax=Aquabacter cavernae TaxID=2496029 RepID=UPI000F8F1414|nr:alpha/beta hydrolase [Aquabacter cavernae]
MSSASSLAETPAASAPDLPLCGIPGSLPPPRGRAGFLRTADGVQIRYAHWPADAGVPARGTVTILTGRTEFIEKYYEVVRDLTARGFAAAIFDWRGQGGSERLLRNSIKGHVSSFKEYQQDLSAFVRQVLFPDCPAPHFVLGHSMGSVVALDSVLEGHRWFDRMVLLTPMLALNLGRGGPVARAMSRTLRPALGWAFIPGGTHRPITERPFATNPVTSDAQRYAQAADMVRAHSGLGLGAPTIGWLAAAFDIMDRLADPEAVRRIRQPLLLVAAGNDRIVSTRAVERLSARLIAGGHVIIPGARHEILMETDPIRAQFWAAFDAFIPGD